MKVHLFFVEIYQVGFSRANSHTPCKLIIYGIHLQNPFYIQGIIVIYIYCWNTCIYGTTPSLNLINIICSEKVMILGRSGIMMSRNVGGNLRSIFYVNFV